MLFCNSSVDMSDKFPHYFRTIRCFHFSSASVCLPTPSPLFDSHRSFSKMAPTKQHLREVMLFHFKEGLSAASSAAKICAVYGQDTTSDRTVQRWYERFRDGGDDVDDRPRSGRPPTVDSAQICALVDSNSHLTLREIALMLNISAGSVHSHLTDAGYVNRSDVWVPHALSERNMMDRLNVSALLIEKDLEIPFLKRLVTGDEKWIVYNNVHRQRSWSAKGSEPTTTVKPRLTPFKIMLCIWWDWKGVVYYELLPRNETINSTKYCQQLDRLKAAIAEKRPELANRRGVVFQHDNARPHTSLVTCKQLLSYSWDVLPHPPYSPDLAPSDYHLFRSIQNSLRDTHFRNEDDVKIHLDRFFSSKSASFWKNGIFSLKKRWGDVIERGGTYIID